MKISNHAAERSEERQGLSLAAFQALAEKALRSGISHSDCKGKLRKFVDGLFLEKRNANNIKIYGHFVYLFRQETLITVLHLPNQYKKLVSKISNATQTKSE